MKGMMVSHKNTQTVTYVERSYNVEVTNGECALFTKGKSYLSGDDER